MPDSGARRIRRLPARVVAVALALVTSACGGVPASGPVTTVRPVEQPGDGAVDRFDDQPVRRLFPKPLAGADPVDVVNGFLDAHADPAADHEVARLYLAPGTNWADREVIVYTGERTARVVPDGADRANAVVSVRQRAIVTAAGEYLPRSGTRQLRMSLERIDREWRIDAVETGLVLLLSEQRFRSSYRRVVRWFPDPTRRYLVPDPVFLPLRPSPALDVLSSLLDGPTSWLRPAVRTAIPADTRVLSARTVESGVADVDLSLEAASAPEDDRPLLLAQLVYTLTEAGLGISGVDLSIEDKPFVVPGAPTDRAQTRADWSEYDPASSRISGSLHVLDDGDLVTVDDQGAQAVVRDLRGAVRVAVSSGGGRLAVVRSEGDGQTVSVAARDGDFVRAASGNRFTTPTWLPASEDFWTARATDAGSELLSVTSAGRSQRLRDDALRRLRVQALHLSPDGTRVALIVGTGDARVLQLGRVERSPAGARFAVTALKAIAPSLRDVTAVAWDGQSRLVVAGQVGTVRSLFRLDSDGFDLVDVASDGLPAEIVAIATAPGKAVHAGLADGTVWRRAAPGPWVKVTDGRSPTFPG